MAFTPRTIITRSLKRIGALAAGETADADDVTDALALLNAMRDSWNAQVQIPPVMTRTPYTLTANDGSYTVGPSGADLTGPRPTPQNLGAARVILVGETRELTLDVLSRQRYIAEPDKTLTDTFPRRLYLEPTVPVSTITLLPIPTTAVALILYVNSLVTSFSIDTSYDFKEGYELAFELELSRLLLNPYGRPAPEGLREDAREAVAVVKRTNEDVDELRCDHALTGGSGVLVGVAVAPIVAVAVAVGVVAPDIPAGV